MQWYHIMNCDLHFLINAAQYLFRCYLPIWVTSLEKYLFKSSAHFSVGLSSFLLLTCISSLFLCSLFTWGRTDIYIVCAVYTCWFAVWLLQQLPANTSIISHKITISFSLSLLLRQGTVGPKADWRQVTFWFYMLSCALTQTHCLKWAGLPWMGQGGDAYYPLH